MAAGCSMATGCSMASVRRMATTARPMTSARPMTTTRMSSGRPSGPRTSVAMKASWDAPTTMIERAPVMTAKIPMIVDRHAV